MEASQAGPSLRRHRLLRAIPWTLIVAFALYLRVAPIGAGLPYLGYVDEGHVLHHVIKILETGNLDTGFYNYPSLPSFMIAGAITGYAPVYQLVHGRTFWEDL